MYWFYQGKDEALEVLRARYQARLETFFYYKGLSDQDAQDLASEVFVRIFETRNQRRGRFDPSKGTFRTWLDTIASNLSVDQGRKSQRKREVCFSDLQKDEEGETEENILDIPDPGPLPEEALLRKERREAIRECINNLPPLQRFAVTSNLFDNTKYRELAARLGCSVTTAHRIVQNALDRIHDCLQSMFDEV